MELRHVAAIAGLLVGGIAFAQDKAKDETTTKQPSTEKKAEKKLAVGDKAPPLTIEKWVKGTPITGFEKGRVYVVEFWATWCGPCVASMPHLSELQKKYKDSVTIIGVTAKDTNGNTLEAVESMVKDKGDRMAYTVAWDEERKTNAAYMKASGQRGIPTSFVVDGTGTLVYIGHPMWLDLPLEKIASGKWDSEKGPKEIQAAEEKLNKVFEAAQDDPKEALKLAAAFEKEYPAAASVFSDAKYMWMLKADDARAPEEGRRIVEHAVKAGDAAALNTFAWNIVDPKSDLKKRDLDLAMKAASKAVELSHEKDGLIMDTLAWVHFLKGDVAKAIELEKKAIDLAPEGRRDELKESLKTFEEGKKKG